MKNTVGYAMASLVCVSLVACGSAAKPTKHGTWHGSGGSTPMHESAGPVTGGAESILALDIAALSGLEQIIPRLAEQRVVFVGETHDRFDHHLNQLAVIRSLYERDSKLAIGMEYFQQPFQRHLDDYIAGKLTEQEMLKLTQYYSRWKYDYRLYAPILRYAREHSIPLIALNVPAEITRQVARKGLDSLTEDQRMAIPDSIDYSVPGYQEFMRQVFEQHPNNEQSRFENFLAAQLLWDEGMAERAAQYLEAHPRRKLVILVGSGHVRFGRGIPVRLARRTSADMAVVLNGDAIEPNLADYILFTRRKGLPPVGRLGIFLEPAEEGLKVTSFADDSAAKDAGIRIGDEVLVLGSEKISSMEDVKLAMWNKRPGDKVPVRVRRSRLLTKESDLAFEVELR